jgi:uncharacterized protein (UPF0548 family)
MFCLRRPTNAEIDALRQAQMSASFSYSEVGATRAELPASYVIDRREVLLGRGQDTFQAACRAMRQWKMFELPWLQLVSTDTPIAEGNVVAVVARTLGLWAVGACRIVYVIDGPRQFGFAYGTLAHVEHGEERFLVEWRPDDTVWYSILAFSRPGSWLTWLSYPYARHCQRSFGAASAQAMQRAVAPTHTEIR